MNGAVAEAARHLCRWRGTGMAWHADVEWTGPDDTENAAGDRLPVVRRGKIVEGAARSIAGSGQARQQHKWVGSAKAAVMPCHRSSCDVSAALAMAKLDGPLEPLLLLVCCEDLSRWPAVERYAVASLHHPFGREAVTDAMHRILWRRPVMSLEARAKSLRLRKDNYAKLRGLADDMLRRWLIDAAERFQSALNA